jgi:hypothetical protein
MSFQPLRSDRRGEAVGRELVGGGGLRLLQASLGIMLEGRDVSFRELTCRSTCQMWG